jgi:twinkle protein
MKVRACYKENKSKQRFLPYESKYRGMFGLNVVGESDEVVVITEGEFDAMAVNMQTGLPALSLPNGKNSLPSEILPYFDRFSRIYLWLDSDEPGRAAVQKFAKKLGPNRCLIIDTRYFDENGPKDANDALRCGYDFKEIFSSARTLNDSKMLRVTDFKDKVLHRMHNVNQMAGI